MKWFPQMEGAGRTDWRVPAMSVIPTSHPQGQRGIAPFNAENRRIVGFDEDFIRHLEVCQVSRGRTPVVHWFNPNAESHARAALSGMPWQPDKLLALELDLEALMIGCCHADDALLMRRVPSMEHLKRLMTRVSICPSCCRWTRNPVASSVVRPWA